MLFGMLQWELRYCSSTVPIVAIEVCNVATVAVADYAVAVGNVTAVVDDVSTGAVAPIFCYHS